MGDSGNSGFSQPSAQYSDLGLLRMEVTFLFESSLPELSSHSLISSVLGDTLGLSSVSGALVVPTPSGSCEDEMIHERKRLAWP